MNFHARNVFLLFLLHERSQFFQRSNIECKSNDLICFQKCPKATMNPEWFVHSKKISVYSDWEYLVQNVLGISAQQDNRRRRLIEQQHYLDISMLFFFGLIEKKFLFRTYE